MKPMKTTKRPRPDVPNVPDVPDVPTRSTRSRPAAKPQRSPLRFLRHPAILLGATAAIAGAVAVTSAGSWLAALRRDLFPPPPPPVTDVRALILDDLEDLQELHTAQRTVTALVTSEQENRLGRFYLGETVLIYQGIGYARAAIDLGDLEVRRVDREAGRIYVVLPPAYLASLELDVNKSGVLEEHRAWIAPNAETQLYAEAERIAVARMRSAACESELFDRAAEQAETLIRDILRAARYTEIGIETQPADRQSCQVTRSSVPSSPPSPPSAI